LSCGLYNKNMTFVNDVSRVVSEWCHNFEHRLQPSSKILVINYAPLVLNYALREHL